MTRTDVDIAEHLTRRRARVMTVLGVYFIAIQGIYFTKLEKFDSWGQWRGVDGVRIAAWFAMALALLALLLSGGGWFRSRAVRALMEDESTRANRQTALAMAFIATMIGAVALYFAAFFRPISGMEAVHLLMTLGIAVGLLRFARLERNSLKGG